MNEKSLKKRYAYCTTQNIANWFPVGQTRKMCLDSSNPKGAASYDSPRN
jgi:hypothetical protein